MEKIKDYTNPITNRFEPGEVVFWKESEYQRFSFTNESGICKNLLHYVSWGIVAEQFHDCVVVDLYTNRDDRIVNGIPMPDLCDSNNGFTGHSDSPNQFDSYGWKKLPKGFKAGQDESVLMKIEERHSTEEEFKLFERVLNYDPVAIKEAVDKGLLIWKGNSTKRYFPCVLINNGRYAIHIQYDKYEYQNKLTFDTARVNARNLYRTADIPVQQVKEALKEDNKYINLSEEEYAVIEFKRMLDSMKCCWPEWNDERVEKAVKWFTSMPNYADIEIKRAFRNIEWKYYDKKRWNLLPEEVTGVM